MGSILGIVIFEQQPTEQELGRFWRNWKYREDEEGDATEKRLPFLGGEFRETTILKVSQIRQDDYQHIGFVITPSQEFYYYYDYETTDPSDYYQRQLYLKPSFEEVLHELIGRYRRGLYLHAKCLL